MKKHHLIIVALSSGTAVVSLPLLADRGPDSGPVARYDMRAGTVSGMGGMGAGKVNPMSLMMGGGMGGKVQHELLLRLGSSSLPGTAKPKADHFMPAGAQLGKSVALATPVEERGPVDEVPNMSGDRTKPSGRILIYWGCGEHAPKGQPFVIDLAKLSAGQMPAGQGLWTSTVLPDWGPNLQNSKTFGRWPAEDGKYAKPESSLIGAHRVVGNYSPEIDFTLTKDFMNPLAVKSAAMPSGAALLSWALVPGTTGLVATIFGSKQGPGGKMGDMVMWSSSANRQFGGGLSDWLSPAQVAPLVKDQTLLTPDTTRCAVPAEVVRDAPDFRMGTLTAFGPEEDFAFPPRPANPKARWDLQWTARIRHRSTTSWMEMQGMTMGTAEQSQTQQGTQNPKQCKPKGGLFGAMAGAITGAGGC